jgi:hypothetical protein
MKKRSAKSASSKTVAEPVSVKFKMKSGETVFFKAIRTSRANGNGRAPRKAQ